MPHFQVPQPAGTLCFKNSVVASEFSPRDRENGKELEISFIDIIGLARSLALVQVEYSLVLDGLATLVYPTKFLLKAQGSSIPVAPGIESR